MYVGRDETDRFIIYVLQDWKGESESKKNGLRIMLAFL